MPAGHPAPLLGALCAVRRALRNDPALDLLAAADTLHRLLATARTVVLARHAPFAEPTAFFEQAPPTAAVDAAVLERTLAFLSMEAAPTPDADAAGWDATALRRALTHAADDLRRFVAGAPPRHPRLVVRPGQWVRYHEYDWGAWTTVQALVLKVSYPTVFVRAVRRGLEAVDLRVLALEPLGRARERWNAFQRRRAWFDLFLDRSRGLRPAAEPADARTTRTVVTVRTCPCCGYPTLDAAAPARDARRVVRCTLCGWRADADADDAEPYRRSADGVALRDARRVFAAVGQAALGADAPTPDSPRAQARAHFDALRRATSADEQLNAWCAAHAALASPREVREVPVPTAEPIVDLATIIPVRA